MDHLVDLIALKSTLQSIRDASEGTLYDVLLCTVTNDRFKTERTPETSGADGSVK